MATIFSSPHSDATDSSLVPTSFPPFSEGIKL